MSEKRFRQFAPFVLLSVLVHIVGLGIFEYLQLWSTGQEAVRVRFTAPRHYTFTLGNGTEGVGLGGPAVPRFQNVPEAQSTSDPESGGFPVLGRDTEPGGKEEWQDTGGRVGSGKVGRPSADSVAKAFEFGHHGAEGRSEDSELSDLLAFDVERRVRTTAVIDRKTGKLKKAYLYLPCYRNHPYVWEGGKELGLIMAAIEGGHRTPDRPPIVPVVDYMFLGMFDPRGSGLHDRVHSFSLSRFPRRHLLNDSELGRYAVILTSYIDLESTETMVRYLLGGGFVICEDVRGLYSAVRDSRGWKSEKLRLISVGKGDRLFHSYYDINEYEFHGIPCAPIAPVPAIEYDGRVVAVSPPKFNYNTSCESNKLFVNALAFGLVQDE